MNDMELVRWEPFMGFKNLHSVLNDWFDDDGDRSPAQPRAWYPAVDVLEGKDAYVIHAELPGMKREDIHVELKDGNLVLSGERKAETLADGVQYRHAERVAAKFWRSFTLPETIKSDSIEAAYKDGVLEVKIPKAEEAKPRQIEISVH
jgi:HSP20 family protein